MEEHPWRPEERPEGVLFFCFFLLGERLAVLPGAQKHGIMLIHTERMRKPAMARNAGI